MQDLMIIVIGLIIGSFLNVCIERIPKNQSIVYPESACTRCHHRLSFLDLIPLISYIFLKGRCRYCQAKISQQYPLVELLNSFGYWMIYTVYGLSIEAFFMAGFFSTLVVLTVIDAKLMLLPTKIIYFGSIWAILFKVSLSYQLQEWHILLQGILTGIGSYCLFAFVFWGCYRVFKREGIGYGDVRYIGMLGLFISPMELWMTLVVACFIGSLYGIVHYYKQHKKSTYFPFGPFLTMGVVVTLILSR